MVMMESAVSGHTFVTIRERLADKVEVLRFDPFSEYRFEDASKSTPLTPHVLAVQQVSIYREKKKIRSM